jgi:hypothetical protein
MKKILSIFLIIILFTAFSFSNVHSQSNNELTELLKKLDPAGQLTGANDAGMGLFDVLGQAEGALGVGAILGGIGALGGFDSLFGGAGSAAGGAAGGAEMMASLIGGKTLGPAEDQECCDGVILGFESVMPSNPHILNGNALWKPTATISYDYGNEFQPTACTLGLVSMGTCQTIESECESPKPMLVIRKIGTSPIGCEYKY